jgi:hypothetical protein
VCREVLHFSVHVKIFGLDEDAGAHISRR